jgi:hypothetical protein
MLPVVPGGCSSPTSLTIAATWPGTARPIEPGYIWHDAGVRTKDEIAFGLTEYFIDRDPQDFVAPFEELLPDRLAA